MIASITSGLMSAGLSVLSTILTKKMFEVIIRKLLINVLGKIVASTENKVDDDLILPIIKELRK